MPLILADGGILSPLTAALFQDPEEIPEALSSFPDTAQMLSRLLGSESAVRSLPSGLDDVTLVFR